MASIFKLGADKGRRNAPYWMEYFDHTGKRRRKKGYTDKQATMDAAVAIEARERDIRLGLVDPEEERLIEHRNAQIEQHLTAFKESLSDNTPKHTKLTMSRVQRIIEGCNVESLAEINKESVETYLRKLRTEEEIGHRTANHYVQALDSFLNWCVETNRLKKNPIAGLERLNCEVDVRRKRRALLPSEMAMVVAAARSSTKRRQGYTGEMRSRVYLVSYLTGLRKSEIASVTPASFNLKSSPPTVMIEATVSKHRRQDVLPLHPELARLLKDWLVGQPQDRKLFPGLARKKTSFMIQEDLKSAGIPYETAAGVADFHAAGRHTHITELFRNGASVPEAKSLARHTDIKMTMKYTHIGLADQAAAVGRVPAPLSAVSNPRESSQYASQQSRGRTRQRKSRADKSRHDDQNASSDITSSEQESFSTEWHQQTRGDTERHHPVKSGGGGNRTRVP